MRVELLFDRECPHVASARANLAQALRQAGLPERWTEWETAKAPAYARGFGSPTVLVEGKDVAGVQPGNSAPSCRLYQSGEGMQGGAPSADLIRNALDAHAASRGPHWRRALLPVPGVVLGALPFGGCPACWPVYAAILSAVGLSFLLSSEYLLPLVAVALLIAVATLAYKARQRRGYAPFAAGLVSAGVILAGKFILGDDRMTYAGVALLVLASAWNAWPPRAAARCPKCVPSGSGLIQLGAQEKSS